MERLRQLLYGLSVSHVIKYIPADNATVLYLQHDRLRPGNVQLSPKRYQMLKSTYCERVQTMMDYVEEADECRSVYLLRYFGQTDSAPCGKCDICRGAVSRAKELGAKLKEWIASRDGKYSLHDLRPVFGMDGDEYLKTLRELIDRKEVPPYE